MRILSNAKEVGWRARLGLASDRIVTDAPDLRRELLRRLSTWDLPSVPTPSDGG